MSTSAHRPSVSDRPSRPQAGAIRNDSPPAPSPPRRPKDDDGRHKSRNAKAEAAEKKSGGGDREKQDPKKVGPWRIGKTIGTGSSGEF